MNDVAAAPSSPMMTAYAAARTAAPGATVLYRVGEFYEVLFDDAERVSKALGIQLTRRRQKDSDGIPMCGIPASSVTGAVSRLLAAGFKVALSQQPLEPSGDRPLQLMTAATSVDPDILAAGRPNNLTVVLAQEQSVGFAWIDVSTGEAGTCWASLEACGPAIARIGPSEILVARWPDASVGLAVAIRSAGTKFADLARPELSRREADALLVKTYGEGFQGAFQGFSPVELAAFAALLDYIFATVGRLPDRLSPPRRWATGDTMEIDSPTLRGLEVLDSPSGFQGALLSVLDRTVTPAGARLLVQQLSAPLTKPDVIRRRLAMVGFLVAAPSVRGNCREDLSGMPDLQRACGRLSIGKGGPRDLAVIRDGLKRAASAAGQLEGQPALPPGLATAAREMAIASEGQCGELGASLRRALIPSPPISINETEFVADGYAQRLDTSRRRAAEVRVAIQDLQQCYAEKTAVKALKIRANSVLGYHIEVPAASATALGEGFTLRQGLASTSRFCTIELDQLAAALASATEQAAQAEQAVFAELRSAVLAARDLLARIARATAALDLVCGLAQAAAEGLWSEPELTDDFSLDIEGGRHPVAEALLAGEARTFVANDCKMDASSRLWLLTGPNMAGKSTFLRQVALIVLLAQIGSFVPASRARIGIVDKLFSRIGASDDLAAGRSTFMVEMLETSAILNQATSRSLVILDEVGRGTSTHDGLSIAQASMEYLHDSVGCRTLFATHFHELAEAAESMKRAACMAMDAAPGSHEEMFAYRVVPGRAGQSYGLKVAAAAGMPPTVLARAAELLAHHQQDPPSAASGNSLHVAVKAG
jgi:DNA mismatch repair protein MutS